MKIKTDFHLHTSDDRVDNIQHTAKKLIDKAAASGFGALAITNHDTFTFSKTLKSYAEDCGILLIPGIERSIYGKHVLILNANPGIEKIQNFAELKSAKKQDDLFIIAPHPFYPTGTCLRNKLLQNIELFDAIEFSYFYTKWFNFNKKAIKVSRQYNLPLIGNSDCHQLDFLGLCHSYLEVESPTQEDIFHAIKNNKVEIKSHPSSMRKLAKIILNMQTSKAKKVWKKVHTRKEAAAQYLPDS